MSPTTLNITSVLFTLLAAFGVMMHDTQIDKAAITALKPPSSIVSNAARSEQLRQAEHVHTERLTDNLRRVTTTDPKTQTRNDDKKYVAIKKANINTANGMNI